ncbi:MAG: DUF262 domain-containing HNH endonuclease family protein [Methanoregula sp.]|nr:DUF262 domain-containing HNH endonuclease family protein [Methanoregula sp.]
MITEPKPNFISDLFSIDSRFDYFIPKYQRSYSWDEEHWSRLYEDINGDESHFLGAIICINRKPGAISAYEIVDGQQRITTITLFFAAIYRRMLELEADRSKFEDNPDFERFILARKNLGQRILREHQVKLTLAIINDDKKNFEALLREVKIIDAPNRELSYQNSMIYRSYSFLYDKISEMDPVPLLKIFKNLRDAHVIQIMADTTSSAYNIFESLNNTGEELGPIDLIKNKFFRDFDRIEHPNFSDENALTYWDNIIKNLSTKDNKIAKNNQIDFLKHYSTTFLLKERLASRGAQIEGRNSNEQLIDIYEKFVVKNPEQFLKVFSKKSDYYSMFLNPEKLGANNVLKNELILLKYISAIPSRIFLLYIFTKYETDELFKKEILKVLIKYFIRQHITKFPDNRNLNKIFQNLIVLCKNTDDLTVNMIEDYLKSPTNSESLDNFENGLRELKYSSSNSNFIRSIFSIIEERYRHIQNPKPFFERDDDDAFTWTLEHILPQKLTESWINTLHVLPGENASEIHKMWVHSLGNLTITAYNGSYSNNPFLYKLNYGDIEGNEKGLKNQRIFLNKDFDNWPEDEDHWTVNDIISRRERLIIAIKRELKYRTE